MTIISHTRIISGCYRLSIVAISIVLLAAGITGCASFKEVRTFASLSANAASYGTLTRDYISALDRRKQYQPQKFHGDLETMKARREAQRASLDLLQQTVTDYMRGLDSLASGDIRTFDRSLDNLSFSLNKATLLDRNEKEAIGALSTLLARTVTTLYRQHEMKQLVQDGNQPLQDVIAATRKIVKRGIVADLQTESALAARYYDNFMFAPGNPAEPVAMALAREARVEALDRVENRIRSAQHYDTVLEKIADGHQYLYDHRDEIGRNDFGQGFKPAVDELRTAYRHLLDVSP